MCATFLQQWPAENTQAIVTSPALQLQGFPNHQVGSMQDLIGYMLGKGKTSPWWRSHPLAPAGLIGSCSGHRALVASAETVPQFSLAFFLGTDALQMQYKLLIECT